MKIFSDYHHGALARWMLYLFGDRLGNDVYFPDSELGTKANAAPTGVWGVWMPQSHTNLAIDDETWDKCGHSCGYDEFMSATWDMVIITRPESIPVFLRLGHPKPGTIYIGVSGNEGTAYDWHWIKHFIASDLSSFNSAPADLHKIHIPQEFGRRFDQGFIPVTEEGLHNVHSFTNNLKGFDNRIPVSCKGGPGVNIFKIWSDMVAALPDHRCACFGHTNKETLGFDCLSEQYLPEKYHAAAVTWNFKTFEGYGHSLLQSLPAGRPVIVPSGFYDTRTAGRYLIEGVTCFHVDYDGADCARKIKEVTGDLDTANENAKRCYDKYKEMFDWQADAECVREWLKETV